MKLARKLAREAGTTVTKGKQPGIDSKQQDHKAKLIRIRRRVYGIHKQLGVPYFAKQAQAKAISAQAKADVIAVESKSLDLFASAAKEAAQQARALAQEAEHKAAAHIKPFHLLASAANDEAQKTQYMARPEVKTKRAEYKEQCNPTPDVKSKHAEYMKQYKAMPEVQSAMKHGW